MTVTLTGKGPVTVDTHFKDNHYIFVPGQHTSPWVYCQNMYTASGALINSQSDVTRLSQWLIQLQGQGHKVEREVWVGGRVQTHLVRPGALVTDVSVIDGQGQLYTKSQLEQCTCFCIPRVVSYSEIVACNV